MGARSAMLLAVLTAACAPSTYAPCPVDVRDLPADAFARCRGVLEERVGAMAVADEQAFLLQTAWVPFGDKAERRASVFRDPAPGVPSALAVVVEVRHIREPLVGLPEWSDSRGDPETERELADALVEALSD
jgi:hypothetical protein